MNNIKKKNMLVYTSVVVSIFLSHLILGLQNSRITGGSDATQGQFPYQISLQNSSSQTHHCGGSILNSKWILTAAQCVNGSSPSDWIIYMGSILLSSGGTYHKLERIIVHEDYTLSPWIANGIAVAELQEDIKFSNYIQSIELETEHVGIIECVLSGWGYLVIHGEVSDHLQYLNVTTITNGECEDAWGSFVGSKDVCTAPGPGYGMCSMTDAGNPLVADGRLIGMMSWSGAPCGFGGPDVAVRISSYLEWIENAINS